MRALNFLPFFGVFLNLSFLNVAIIPAPELADFPLVAFKEKVFEPVAAAATELVPIEAVTKAVIAKELRRSVERRVGKSCSLRRLRSL